jgi:hypothetical protein
MSRLSSNGKIDGRVESAQDGQVVGWAWRKGESEPVEIEVLVDGEAVATVTARAKRGALRRAGIGTGRHGFVVELPDELADEGQRKLDVFVLPDRVPLPGAAGFRGDSTAGAWQSTRFTIANQKAPPAVEAELADPATTNADAARPAPVAAEPPGPQPKGIAGVVESVADGVVGGWVAEGYGKIAVTIDGRVVAKAKPKLSRPDLQPGAGGFRAALPDELREGGPHVLVVEVGGEPLAVAPQCLRPSLAPAGEWAGADLRLALLDEDAIAEDPPRTLLGPGAWRFEVDGQGRELEDAELDRLAELLLGWNAGVQRLRVPHLFAVLPARERLEREWMPAALRADAVSANLERLAERLSDDRRIGFLDLLPALEEAREAGPVYLRTGTGLTPRGAAAVVGAMLTKAASRVGNLTIPDPDRLQLRPVRGFRGDLAGRRAAMAEGSLIVELPPLVVPPEALAEEVELPAPGTLGALRAPTPRHLADLADPRPPVVFECEGVPDVRIALLGSGLPPALIAMTAEQAARTVVIDRDEPPLEALELELPHVVLHVLAERSLPKLAGA